MIAPEKSKRKRRPGGDPSSDPDPSSGDGKKKKDDDPRKKKKTRNEDDGSSRSGEKKPLRKRRKKHRKKDKSSSSRSSRSSEDEIYGKETAKYESLMEKAKRHPGKLLRSGLEQMSRFMNTRSGDDLAPSVSWREQRVNEYLNQVLFNQHPASSMGMRNARELVTLATCIDLLMEEQFASLGDVLMQRLKAVEASLSEGWSVANFQELIPPPKATLTSDQERAFAARHALQQRKQCPQEGGLGSWRLGSWEAGPCPSDATPYKSRPAKCLEETSAWWGVFPSTHEGCSGSSKGPDGPAKGFTCEATCGEGRGHEDPRERSWGGDREEEEGEAREESSSHWIGALNWEQRESGEPSLRQPIQRRGSLRQGEEEVKEPHCPQSIWKEAEGEREERAVRQSQVCRPHRQQRGGRESAARRKRREAQKQWQRKRKREVKTKGQERKGKREGEVWEGFLSFKDWRKEIRGAGDPPLSLVGHTKKLVRCLVGAPGPLGSSLRALLNSPPGRAGVVNRAGDPYPLPLPPSFRYGLMAVAKGLKQKNFGAGMPPGLQINRSNKRECVLKACTLAWGGLQVLALNTSRGVTTVATIDEVRNPLKKKVLSCLLSNAECFMQGDGLSKDVVLRPEVPWRSRISDLSVGYTGEVLEKARWLSWAQVEPGLPPVGKGGLLWAPDFCDGWVAEHLTNANLSRIPDELIEDWE